MPVFFVTGRTQVWNSTSAYSRILTYPLPDFSISICMRRTWNQPNFGSLLFYLVTSAFNPVYANSKQNRKSYPFQLQWSTFEPHPFPVTLHFLSCFGRVQPRNQPLWWCLSILLPPLEEIKWEQNCPTWSNENVVCQINGCTLNQIKVAQTADTALYLPTQIKLQK